MTTASEALPARPQRAAGWRALPSPLRRGILLALLIGTWQAYVSLGHVDKLLFASPADTARTFVEGWANGSLAHPTAETLKILGLGLAIGTAIASFFAIAASLTTVGEDLLQLLSSILNPLPGVAVLPLAMLWFGLNTKAILFAIANATIWPIALNVSTGFKTANPTIVAVGRNIGLSRWRVVTDVLVPAALPHAITGLKTAWAFAWRTIIAAELVFGVAGSRGGLGTYINNAKLYLLIPQVFAGLVTIAVLGVLFEYLFSVLERRTVVRWGMQAS